MHECRCALETRTLVLLCVRVSLIIALTGVAEMVTVVVMVEMRIAPGAQVPRPSKRKTRYFLHGGAYCTTTTPCVFSK